MKSILRTAAAGLAIASIGIASSASAQTSATATVRAEILSTLQVDVDPTDNVLNFGQIADTGVVGSSTLILSPTAVPTCGANLNCLGPFNTPTFNIQGLTGSSVLVTLPANSVLTFGGTVPTGMDGDMTVSAYTTNQAGNTLLLAAGLNPFSVGGTLTVSALQAPGIYTGSVTVNVEYN